MKTPSSLPRLPASLMAAILSLPLICLPTQGQGGDPFAGSAFDPNNRGGASLPDRPPPALRNKPRTTPRVGEIPGSGRYTDLPERTAPGYAPRTPRPGATLSGSGRPIALPNGDELLRQVQSRLPRDRMMFPATLRGTTTEGKRVQVPAEIELDWAAAEPNATYTLLDGRGLPKLAMRVVWKPDQKPDIEFRSGPSLTIVPNVRITDKIEGLELTWSDLSLSFIWWRGGKTLGGGIKKLNRKCFLVEVPAPAWEARLYHKAHLWIDDKERMAVQGQTFTASGRPLRYFEVDEIGAYKKDHWMAKKLEFASFDLRGRKRHKVYIDIDVKGGRALLR